MKPKEYGKGGLVSKKYPKASSRAKGKVPAHSKAQMELLASSGGPIVFIFSTTTSREGEKITTQMEGQRMDHDVLEVERLSRDWSLRYRMTSHLLGIRLELSRSPERQPIYDSL